MLKNDLAFPSISVASDRERIFVGTNNQNAVSELHASQPMLAHFLDTQDMIPEVWWLLGCYESSEPFWHSERVSVQLNKRDVD